MIGEKVIGKIFNDNLIDLSKNNKKDMGSIL